MDAMGDFTVMLVLCLVGGSAWVVWCLLALLVRVQYWLALVERGAALLSRNTFAMEGDHTSAAGHKTRREAQKREGGRAKGEESKGETETSTRGEEKVTRRRRSAAEEEEEKGRKSGKLQLGPLGVRV